MDTRRANTKKHMQILGKKYKEKGTSFNIGDQEEDKKIQIPIDTARKTNV